MSETLQIKKQNAIEAFKNGSTSDRKLLSNLFGKEVFSENICDIVKTIEDACEITGEDYKNEPDEYKQAEKAIEIFAKALREGKPESECWYFPWFKQSSGGGFSYSACALDFATPSVGARLRVDTAEKAKHLGTCMLSFYKTYLTGK